MKSSVAAVVGILALTGVSDIGDVKAQQPTRAAPGAKAPSAIDAVLDPVARWFERANREYQVEVVGPLSVPTGKGVGLPARAPQSVAAGAPKTASPGEPTLIEQLREYLGIEVAKGPVKADPPTAAAPSRSAGEIAAAEQQVRKQIEARAIEQQRAAEDQRLAAEARRAKEAVDLATQQRQKAAESARLAEDERRKGAKSVEPARPAVTAADESKVADEAKRVREAAEQREVAAKEQREKAAAQEREKVAAEQRSRLAAEQRQAAAAEQRDRKAADDNAKLAQAARDQDKAREDEARKRVESSRAEAAAAAKLADAANKAASKVLQRNSGERGNRENPRLALVSADGAPRHRTRNGCSRAGSAVSPPAVYVVKAGDTLWGIARRYYDKGSRFGRIVRANEAKIDSPDLIFPCQKFFLPGRTALEWVVGGYRFEDES